MVRQVALGLLANQKNKGKPFAAETFYLAFGSSAKKLGLAVDPQVRSLCCVLSPGGMVNQRHSPA